MLINDSDDIAFLLLGQLFLAMSVKYGGIDYFRADFFFSAEVELSVDCHSIQFSSYDSWNNYTAS